MAKRLTQEQLDYIQQYLRDHPGATGPIPGMPGVQPSFGSNPGFTIGLGPGGFGGERPPIGGGSYDPTIPTFPGGPFLPPGFNNPTPTTPTTPTGTTPTKPKRDWLGLLGKFAGSKAGDIGKILADMAANRAKGRVDEATTNIKLQELENDMYADALRRSIVGRMMQVNFDPDTPPANLVPYLPENLRGTRDFTAGRDDTYAKSLVSGAAATLAHPPTFDASKMTSAPNWIDKTLNLASPILSGLGVFGKNPTTPTPMPTPPAPPPTTPTPPPTTPMTPPTLPAYTSPSLPGAGSLTPTDPSDPWNIYLEQQRRRRLGQPGL